MPAPFIIPFNNNPLSTTIKNASYTIPAGKYAKIIPHGSKLLINGVSAYPSVALSMTATSVALGAITNDSITLNTNDMYLESLSITQSRSGTAASSNCTFLFLDFNGENTLYSVTKVYALSTTNYSPLVQSISPFNSVSLTATAVASGTSGQVNHVAVMTFYVKKDLYSLWAPTGTVIDSPFFALEEYNNIT